MEEEKEIEEEKDEEEDEAEEVAGIRWDYSGLVSRKEILKVHEPRSLHEVDLSQFPHREILTHHDIEAILHHPPVVGHARTLRLSDQGLPTFPLIICDYAALRELDLYGNHLRDLPQELSRLQHLEVLVLGDNKLNRFPQPLLSLGGLKELNLSSNELQELPEFRPGDLPSLTELRLSSNQLNRIPASISNLRSLGYLSLFRNWIEEIPGSLAELPNLHSLDIQNNPLVEVPQILQDKFNPMKLATSIPNEIIPGRLFIGDWEGAHNTRFLRKRNIKRILSICEDRPRVDPAEFEHKFLQLPDAPGARLGDRFAECFEFIDRDRSQPGVGGATLVHCMAGVSRSATVCIGYLMKEEGLTFQLAHDRLLRVRPIVHPNRGFVEQLLRFQLEIQSTQVAN